MSLLIGAKSVFLRPRATRNCVVWRSETNFGNAMDVANIACF